MVKIRLIKSCTVNERDYRYGSQITVDGDTALTLVSRGIAAARDDREIRSLRSKTRSMRTSK